MIDLKENKVTDFGKDKFKELSEFLREQDDAKKTRFVTFDRWSLVEEGLRLKKKDGKSRTYPMRDSGMRTLLKVLGMPTSFYYKKAPTDMLIRDINRMNDEYSRDSEVLVHLQDKEIRAVAKPNANNLKFHQALLDAADVSKQSFNMASYSDYGLRIIVTKDDIKPIEVKKGDIISSGCELMYSDIGYFPTTGVPHLTRLICTNGAVLREKNPLLTMFALSFTRKQSEDYFLKHVHEGVQNIDADTKKLAGIFKAMRDHQIKDLTNGELLAKKIRSAMGVTKFDEHDKLSIKIMDGSDEKAVVNTDLGLYDFMDVVTRMAKSYNYLTRRKIEGLVGSMIIKSNALVPTRTAVH